MNIFEEYTAKYTTANIVSFRNESSCALIFYVEVYILDLWYWMISINYPEKHSEKTRKREKKKEKYVEASMWKRWKREWVILN